MNIVLSNMNFLSPDARCYSFDHRANGYSRGEGFGVIVLKLLSKAIQDGDTIRALIRSTGVNQDGHTSSGITQPSKDSQAQLISDTYQKAGLDKQLTRYFEAHGRISHRIDGLANSNDIAGTGTAIGDPLEARAIGESFYQSRCAEDPLYM
jgi:acyl transferase domain-containing protein